VVGGQLEGLSLAAAGVVAGLVVEDQVEGFSPAVAQVVAVLLPDVPKPQSRLRDYLAQSLVPTLNGVQCSQWTRIQDRKYLLNRKYSDHDDF
jgi:hypothetical protein